MIPRPMVYPTICRDDNQTCSKSEHHAGKERYAPQSWYGIVVYLPTVGQVIKVLPFTIIKDGWRKDSPAGQTEYKSTK